MLTHAPGEVARATHQRHRYSCTGAQQHRDHAPTDRTPLHRQTAPQAAYRRTQLETHAQVSLRSCQDSRAIARTSPATRRASGRR